jgi:hypothetical protein
MRIKFNTVLRQLGVDPSTVLLLRHTISERYGSVYDLWRKGGTAFDTFLQNRDNRHRGQLTSRRFWAHFVKDPYGETLFICLVEAEYTGPSRVQDPNRYDLYQVTRLPDFSDLEGKLVIEWGAAKMSWCQNADNQNKDIIELRKELGQSSGPTDIAVARRTSILDFPRLDLGTVLCPLGPDDDLLGEMLDEAWS